MKRSLLEISPKQNNNSDKYGPLDDNYDGPVCEECGARATHIVYCDWQKYKLDESGDAGPLVDSWSNDCVDSYYLCDNC